MKTKNYPPLKFFLNFFLFGSTITITAQTGPGGVGSSATNVFWLDANSGTSLNGPNVTAWADRSGNNSDATPAAANARPTLVSNNVNGYPSIDFDGNNDELRITDKASLDLTTWHFFMVVSVDNQKDYNAWCTKGDDGAENFELLSYGTGGSIGNIHTPFISTGGVRTFPSTGSGMVTTGNVFNIIEYSYSSAVGRDVYKNYANQYTDNDNATPQTNNYDIYIGNEKTTSRFLDGDIAELISYNAIQNAAGRTIVNNYLSSKYNIALSSGDLYGGDTGAKGDYDYNVAGIGQASAGNVNNAFSASASAGMGITYVSGFQDGDYIFAGNNLKTQTNNASTVDVGGLIGALPQRWLRTWYVDVTNAGANMVTNVTFDMSDGDLAGIIPAIPANYVLLSRAGTSGNWTVSGIVPTILGDAITFSGVTLSDGYYTIGTLNANFSVLPIELIDFTSTCKIDGVQLNWSTASEHDNDYFMIERSTNGKEWDVISHINSNGNSSTINNYVHTDFTRNNDITYYRLSQVDLNGNVNVFKTIDVNCNEKINDHMILFPNPSIDELNVLLTVNEPVNDCLIRIFSNSGSVVFEIKVNLEKGLNTQVLPVDFEPGSYTVIVTSDKIVIPSQKLVVIKP